MILYPVFSDEPVLQVLIPNGAYRGQKPTRLVAINTPPSTSNTSPIVPVTVPLK